MLVLLLTVVTLLIYVYFKYAFSYWSRHNIPQEPPSIPFFSNKGKRHIALEIDEIFQRMKAKNYSHYGWYFGMSPIYIPIDPRIAKRILSTDFENFINRGLYYNKDKTPLTAHLATAEDEYWKLLRSKMGTAFTSAKLKCYLSDMYKFSDVLLKALNAKPDGVNAKELFGKFISSVVASTAFGIELNLFENDNPDFIQNLKKILKPGWSAKVAIMLSFIGSHDLLRKLGLIAISQDAHDYYHSLVKQIVTMRESKNIVRNDLMQTLINMKNDKLLSFDEAAAQAYIMFLAGFETNSTTASFALYEIAKNPEIQNKLREELAKVQQKHSDITSYEALEDFKYLRQIINETMRLYPTLYINRICKNDYELPEFNLKLKKGTQVSIPIYSYHRSKEYFEDPEVFNPDRFAPENVHNIIPYTYMPFGAGPRSCIGFRLGELLVKLAILTVISNFKVKLNKNSPANITLHPDGTFLYTSEHNIYLDLEHI